MATNRKLQAEIDRVLKKVDEGLDVFNDIWDKVYSAQNVAQRDKFEAELKSQIKKLQRLRDQIKTWQADSSVKDKSKIDVARRRIEEKMEAFKVCERETKTKAFSKEGLALDREDPQERAKNEVREWVRECIARLKVQIEEREADIESTVTASKKKKGVDQETVEALRHRIERHQFHIEMLERVLRALDNDGVECDVVNEIRDSVEYYVESNHEDDYIEDDEMYDGLNLDALVDTAPIPVVRPKEEAEAERPDDKARDSGEGDKRDAAERKRADEEARRKREAAALEEARRQRESGEGSRPGVDATAGKSKEPAPREAAAAVAVAKGKAGGTVAAGVAAAAAAPTSSAWANQQQPAAALLSKQNHAATTPAPVASVAPVVESAAGPAPPVSQRMPAGLEGGAAASAPLDTAPFLSPDAFDKNGRQVPPGAVFASPAPTASSAPPLSGARSATEDDTQLAAEALLGMAGRATPSTLPAASTPLPSGQPLALVLRQLEQAAMMLPDFRHPRFGSSSSSTTTTVPFPDGNNNNNNEAGVEYTPRNPYPVHPSFPAVPAPALDAPAMYDKLDIDTLFFLFFFHREKRQQYHAARELKRQAWRFHRRYLTWFQRHEEPRITTEEYESGAYVYLDSQMWCQRVKREFLFSYADLEDELAVL